jgi:hypothetical protein
VRGLAAYGIVQFDSWLNGLGNLNTVPSNSLSIQSVVEEYKRLCHGYLNWSKDYPGTTMWAGVFRNGMCFDGKLNNGEEQIDCGGSNCYKCPTCTDGTKNNGEEGVDCGGPCKKCSTDADRVIRGFACSDFTAPKVEIKLSGTQEFVSLSCSDSTGLWGTLPLCRHIRPGVFTGGCVRGDYVPFGNIFAPRFCKDDIEADQGRICAFGVTGNTINNPLEPGNYPPFSTYIYATSPPSNHSLIPSSSSSPLSLS